MAGSIRPRLLSRGIWKIDVDTAWSSEAMSLFQRGFCESSFGPFQHLPQMLWGELPITQALANYSPHVWYKLSSAHIEHQREPCQRTDHRLLSAQEWALDIYAPICYSRGSQRSMLLKKLRVSWLVRICNKIVLLERQSRLWRRCCTVRMRSGSIKHHLCVSYRKV